MAIRAGRIVAIEADRAESADRVIDALGEYLSGSAPWLTLEETDFARYMDRWPDIAVTPSCRSATTRCA